MDIKHASACAWIFLSSLLFVLNKLPLKVSREYVPSFDAKEKINFRIMQPMSTIVKSK
jgi:hypothetical protein